MTSNDAPAQAPLPFAKADVLEVVPEAASELAAELAFKAAPETVSETAPETAPKTAPNATPTRLPAPQTTTAMPLHIYRRDILPTDRTSLSVIAELIATGSTVLDLGTGSGSTAMVMPNMP